MSKPQKLRLSLPAIVGALLYLALIILMYLAYARFEYPSIVEHRRVSYEAMATIDIGDDKKEVLRKLENALSDGTRIKDHGDYVSVILQNYTMTWGGRLGFVYFREGRVSSVVVRDMDHVDHPSDAPPDRGEPMPGGPLDAPRERE